MSVQKLLSPREIAQQIAAIPERDDVARVIEAAKAVAEMAAPIASAVTAVLGLFGLAM